ncbi:MAG: DHH family phosphoesterase [Candidatus Woesearchaeota archaeon]
MIPPEANERLIKIKNIIESSKNPYFLFDDDPDGLCSFLLIYKKIRKGEFSVVRGKPLPGQNYILYAKNRGADLVIVLDKPELETNFSPLVWIDHHPVQETNAIYFNPLLYNLPEYPTTYWVHLIFPKFKFISAIGIVSDWFVLPIVKEIASDEKYAYLFPKKLTPEEILFNSEFGKICKAFTFILKGDSYQVKRDIKKLVEIEDYENVYNYFPRIKSIESSYQKLLSKALNEKYENIVLFLYKSKHSFSGLLSNELLYHFPEKDLIIVGRETTTNISFSLRSKRHNVNKILQSALIGIRGSGGGHEKACGAIIAKRDLDLFLENLEFNVKKLVHEN